MRQIKITSITSALLAGLAIAACTVLASCENKNIDSGTPTASSRIPTVSSSTGQEPVADSLSESSQYTAQTLETTAEADTTSVSVEPGTSLPWTEPVTTATVPSETSVEPTTPESKTESIPETTPAQTTPETTPAQTTPAATTAAPPTTTVTTAAEPTTTVTTTVTPTTTVTTTAVPTTAATTAPIPTTAVTPQITQPVTPPTAGTDDPPETDHHASGELVRVKDFIPDIFVDLRYAGSNNGAGFPIYNYSDAYLRYGTVKKLEKVQEALKKEGLSLLLWDAFRPLDAQYALSVILPNKGTSPVSGKVAFNYGGTVSLAIVKSDGTAVALPSDFDEDGTKSDRNFSDLSAEAAKYGRMLDDLMLKNGFKHYLDKWYRYTDTNGYSQITATTLDERGAVDCAQWIVTCSSTVNMRKGPASSYDIIKKLPNNTKVTVAFFHEKYAFVTVDGITGYISAGYLRRPEEQSYEKELSAVTVVENYSYEMMQEDLAELANRYPDLLSISSIGKSEEGRDLTLAVLGNPEAENQIFVSAGIHAREHMNVTFTMAQIDYMLNNLDKPFGKDGRTVREILSETCFRILPMSNPDGVHIVQTGELPDEFKDQYGSSIAALWKANAKGVDLNANFDADWERYGGADAEKSPGYMGYKGSAPECAAESKAIADYVRAMDFDLVLCYHCTGSVVYWEYGDNTAVNNQNRELALRLTMTSGYSLGTPGPNSTAGLKDYVVDKLGIPSLTIEFGTTECPMELREFSNLWERCRYTLLTCALWVQEK